MQSLTNLYGQGLAGDAKFIGGWFYRIPNTMLISTPIMDVPVNYSGDQRRGRTIR
ncbi:hypothetical protein N9Y61_03120 [Paracoccaceae bacterium]|nr:hypothetical protein [Paracoccaceae bacterium]